MRFGERARQYRERAVVQRDVAAWCGRWIEPDCSALTALELGAGAGLFTDILAEKNFAKLTASDLSHRMVEEGDRCVPAAEWRQLDAWAPLPEQYDRLYSCSLLQWASEPERVLSHWRQSLNPGGKALLALFVEGTLAEFNVGHREFSAVRLRGADEWLSHFSSAGFTILRQEQLKRVFRHESAVAALRSVHDIGAVSEPRIGTAELRAFLASRDAAHRADGFFPLTWIALKAELSA